MQVYVCEYLSAGGIFGMNFVSAETPQEALNAWNEFVDQDDDWNVRLFAVPSVATRAGVHQERVILLVMDQPSNMAAGLDDAYHSEAPE